MSFPNSSFARAGKYTQIQLIGQGSGGNVYRAVDNIGRLVAVKEALPSHAGFIDTLERFEKEARIQATLKHPNIIQVYHLEAEPQTHELYLICEYANGGSLADHLKAHGPLPEEQAIRIALDICTALEEVSKKLFVHRDIKPSNILLFKDDQGQITEAKLADFGVAKDLDKQRAGQPSTQRGGSHSGTPEYMPPEQADITKPVDVRTDLYALGISLWEMLTETDYKLVRASTGTPVLHTHNPQASPGVAEVIQRAVGEDPADRYPTPRAMCADLQDVLRSRPLAAPPTTVFGPRTPPPRAQVGLIRTAVLVLGLVLALGISLAWLKTWIYEREAENPAQSTVGQTLQRPHASGGQVHGQFGTVPTPPWQLKSGYVTYNITSFSLVTHWYLKLRYSKYSPSSVPILIFLDNGPVQRVTLFPLDQGSWDQFVWTEPIDLGNVWIGVHSIKFYTDGQQYGVADLDRFVLTTEPPSVVLAPTQ